MRTADDAVAVEMNPSQVSELSSRLTGVKNTKRSDEFAGFTQDIKSAPSWTMAHEIITKTMVHRNRIAPL